MSVINTKEKEVSKERRKFFTDRKAPPPLEEISIKKPQINKPFIDREELPSNYNTTYITLIARDPNWIHAYWEISSSSIKEAKKNLGEDFEKAVYVLRMYDITCIEFNGYNANHWFDIEVGPFTNNWYINLWCDNVTYCGEIGLRTKEGKFLPFARSNIVHTPRLGPSYRDDLIWMEVKDDKTTAPFVFVEEKQRNKYNKEKKQLPLKFQGKRFYLTEDDVKAYYSRLFPTLKKVLARPLSKRDFKENIFIRNPQKEFLLGNNPNITKEFIRKILLGASEELAVSKKASEFMHFKGGASEKEIPLRKFFFELWTELIVYGRTEPQAEVRFFDKKVPLREDGTFTLRFSLPEGNIPLEFIAYSKDKIDQRKISTAVNRDKTIYNP